MYPNRYRRRYNLARDQANGAPDSTVPAKVDVELNDLSQSLDLLNTAVRGITTSDGQLKNVAAAIAQALAGAQRLSTTLGQTVLTTTIVWQADFSNLSVQLLNNGTAIDPSLVSVANAGGFLQVTVSGGVAAGWTLVAAFQQGAGILTTLASTADDDGASLIGVEDSGGLYLTSTVEDALAEVMTALNAYVVAVGNLTTLLRKDGTNWPPTANLAMGGFKLTGLAAGTTNGDSVRYEQLQAYVNALTAFAALFLKLDGTTPMTGALDFGTQKGIHLGAAVDPTDVPQFQQVLHITGGTLTGPLDLGPFKVTTTEVPAADNELTNKLYVDGQVQAVAAGLRLNVHDVTTPGTSTWVVPAGVTRLRVRTWGAGGGGYDSNAVGAGGGGGGGYSESLPAVTPGNTLTIVCGAGGAKGTPGTVGGASSVSAPGPVTLCSAAGGGVAASKAVQGAGGAIAGTVGLIQWPGASGRGNSIDGQGAIGGNAGGPGGGQGGSGGIDGDQPGGGGGAQTPFTQPASNGGAGRVLIEF